MGRASDVTKLLRLSWRLFLAFIRLRSCAAADVFFNPSFRIIWMLTLARLYLEQREAGGCSSGK